MQYEISKMLFSYVRKFQHLHDYNSKRFKLKNLTKTGLFQIVFPFFYFSRFLCSKDFSPCSKLPLLKIGRRNTFFHMTFKNVWSLNYDVFPVLVNSVAIHQLLQVGSVGEMGQIMTWIAWVDKIWHGSTFWRG